jgi:uncharacterized protein YndB with AHSA1/START domain
MAIVAGMIDQPPEAVWRILADDSRYADWVGGAQRVRRVEESWPAVGSKFYHSVGLGPVRLWEDTEVPEMDDCERLVVEARIRPLGRPTELVIATAQRSAKVMISEAIVTLPGENVGQCSIRRCMSVILRHFAGWSRSFANRRSELFRAVHTNLPTRRSGHSLEDHQRTVQHHEGGTRGQLPVHAFSAAGDDHGP